MVFQPIYTIENCVSSVQGSLERCGMPCQLSPLLGNTHLQGTMPSSQFEQFGIHSV
jgi:hypothetical protein